MDSQIWLKNYPKGVPAEIDINRFQSFADLLLLGCIKYRNQPAFVNMGQILTFDDILLYAEQFTSYIQNYTDLQPGDKIAIQSPNLLQYPVLLIGALKAGLVVVNVNPLYTPREMEHQLKDSNAKAIIILENFAYNLEKIITNTEIKYVISTAVGDMIDGLKGKLINFVVRKVKKIVPDFNLKNAITLPQALEMGARKTAKDIEIKLQDIAFLQYTGGTTGVSKGAMLTHGNMVANVLQAEAWINQVLKEGEDRILTALPLYHIFALTVNFALFVHLGGLNILITNPREMKSMIKDIRKYKPTIITGVNTLFNGLLNQSEFRELDFNDLKLGVAGGMALQSDVVRRWINTTKTDLMEGYGLTEASPATNFNPPDGRIRIGSVGLPLPSTSIKIVDDNGNEVLTRQIGEICIKGPQVMLGYWKRPDETAKTLKDGWLITGDIGYMSEDGYLTIVDRKKDMILVSGFNVYPNEIEEVLSTHPAVVEVAAVGVPDENSGEAVKVFVVKSGGLTINELESFAKQNLTGYKRPKYYEFRTELPKSNVGKILRKPLRDEELKKRSTK